MPAHHLRAHPLRGVGVGDLFTVDAVLAVGQTHQLAGDTETFGDADQQVVGQYPAASKYLGDLGLRLPSQPRDRPLGEPALVPEQPVQGGDVAGGQHRAHLGPPVPLRRWRPTITTGAAAAMVVR